MRNAKQKSWENKNGGKYWKADDTGSCNEVRNLIGRILNTVW